MRLAMLVPGFIVVAACGPSSAEVKQATEASYQVDRAVLWKELVAEMHDQNPATGLDVEDENGGVIQSKWKSIEASQSSNDKNMAGNLEARPERLVFRTLVKIQPGGPPWVLLVDGQAARYQPEMSALQIFKPGADDEPAWVKERIMSLRMAIHRRLKQYAVGPILRI